MKAEGRRQIHLWVKNEDVAAIQEAARTGHGLARRLELRTQRALLAQARAEAREHPADSNAPPARVRFAYRPPRGFRRRCRAAGWRYDPVAAVWHLPEDPGRWDAALELLAEAEAAGRPFERLGPPEARDPP